MRNQSSNPAVPFGAHTVSLSHEAVAHLAAETWKTEGCPTGRDMEFWLRAEHQLRTAMAEASLKHRPSGSQPANS